MIGKDLAFGFALLVSGVCFAHAQVPITGAGKVPTAGCPVGVTTLDPANKGASSAIVLSNCDLTATSGVSPSNASNVRGTASHTTLVYFCSFLITTTAGGESVGIGIANTSFVIGDPASGKWLGNGTASSSIASYDTGTVYENGSSIGTMPAYTSGDVVDLWVNLDVGVGTGLFAVRVNGGNWNGNVANTPTVGALGFTSGTWWPAIQTNAVGDTLTVNFGATAYTYAPPGGTNNW
jgi:hypothetical protein